MENQSLKLAQALAHQINNSCPQDAQFDSQNIFDADLVKEKIANKEWWKSHCTVDTQEWDENKSCRPRKDEEWMSESADQRKLRYFLCGHANITKRKNYLDDPESSAFIFHLAEGRRDDAYNQIEFEILKLLGFDRSRVSLVHGLGLSQEDYKHMAEKGMGLIWSPYSNLLLYGQSLDFTKLNKDVVIALGSDWTPTGTKSLLEEVKIARNYLLKKSYGSSFGDEALYHMMTENPAKIIRAEGLVGTLKPAAMASIMVASQKDKNPYTNIVRDIGAEDVNLVLVDGQIIYGNESYLKRADYLPSEYEVMPQYVGESLRDWVTADSQSPLGYRYKFPDLPVPPQGLSRASALVKWAYNVELGNWVQNHREAFKVQNPNSQCRFSDRKVFVRPTELGGDSIAEEIPIPSRFKAETGLNLNSYLDIQMLLSVALVTQNGNIHDTKWGDMKARISHLPSLYTCNDRVAYERQAHFIKVGAEGEYSKNKNKANSDRPVSDPLCQAFETCHNH